MQHRGYGIEGNDGQMTVVRWGVVHARALATVGECKAFIDGREQGIEAEKTAARHATPYTDTRACYVCGRPANEHPMEPDPRGGMRRGNCPVPSNAVGKPTPD